MRTVRGFLTPLLMYGSRDPGQELLAGRGEIQDRGDDNDEPDKAPDPDDPDLFLGDVDGVFGIVFCEIFRPLPLQRVMRPPIIVFFLRLELRHALSPSPAGSTTRRAQVSMHNVRERVKGISFHAMDRAVGGIAHHFRERHCKANQY